MHNAFENLKPSVLNPCPECRRHESLVITLSYSIHRITCSCGYGFTYKPQLELDTIWREEPTFCLLAMIKQWNDLTPDTCWKDGEYVFEDR